MEILNPSNKKIKGPLFLSKESIVVLNDKINSIDEYLVNIFNNDIVERIIEEKKLSYNEKKSDDELRSVILSRISNNYKKIIVHTKENITLTINSIEELLKDEIVKNYNIVDINIKINRNYHEFEMDIQHSSFNSLNYRMSGLEEKDKKEINYYIDSWTSSIIPNKIIYAWSHYYGFVFFIISTIFCFFSIMNLVDSNKNSALKIYQYELQKESSILIENGITSPDQQNKALVILLKYVSSYIPEDFQTPPKNNKFIYETLIIYILLFLLLIVPKTVFEIGKEELKFRITQMWIKLVLFIIPTMILIPIIINKIS